MKKITCRFNISLFAGSFVLAELMISCGKETPNRALLRTNLPIIDSKAGR